MESKSNTWRVISWMFFVILLAISILNIIFIDVLQAILYLVIALIYLPYTDRQLKRILNITLRPVFKITLFIIIILVTIVVSNLLELIETWIKAI